MVFQTLNLGKCLTASFNEESCYVLPTYCSKPLVELEPYSDDTPTGISVEFRKIK